MNRVRKSAVIYAALLILSLMKDAPLLYVLFRSSAQFFLEIKPQS